MVSLFFKCDNKSDLLLINEPGPRLNLIFVI